MKQRLFTYILLAFTCLGLQSCLFQEEDVFEGSSAVRATAAVTEVQELLQNAPNGWKLEYYVGADYALGGTTILMRFDDKNVGMAAEYGPDGYKPGTVVESLYQVTAEQTTMITFDTYNSLLHTYSAPLDINMNLEGDYEFIVMDASEDKIVLQGKRYGNIMEMFPVPKDIPWRIMLDDIRVIEQDANERAYRLEKNGELRKFFMRGNGTFATFSVSDAAMTAAGTLSYIYTEKGLRFCTAYDMNGESIQNFEWDKKKHRFVCVDAGMSDVTLTGYIPENRIPYDTYLGEYEATVSRVNADNQIETSKLSVTISADVTGESYILKGLLPVDELGISLDIPLLYDKTTGELILDSQLLGTYNDYYYFACTAGGGNYAHTELNLPPLIRSGLSSIIDTQKPLTLHFADKMNAIDNSLLVWIYDSDKLSISSFLGYLDYLTLISLTKQYTQN